MTGSQRGFTLIELLMVIAIICILASLTIVGIPTIIRKSKEAATRIEIADFTRALSQYDTDNGSYPASTPDYSSTVLIEHLQGDPFSSPLRKRYYSFKADRITSKGYLSRLDFLYYYRENTSVSPKTPDMHNWDGFDIWTNDGRGNEAKINNWD